TVCTLHDGMPLMKTVDDFGVFRIKLNVIHSRKLIAFVWRLVGYFVPVVSSIFAIKDRITTRNNSVWLLRRNAQAKRTLNGIRAWSQIKVLPGCAIVSTPEDTIAASVDDMRVGWIESKFRNKTSVWSNRDPLIRFCESDRT